MNALQMRSLLSAFAAALAFAASTLAFSAAALASAAAARPWLQQLLEAVARAGSWSAWMGVFDRGWMELLQAGGMSYARARCLTKRAARCAACTQPMRVGGERWAPCAQHARCLL